jgi:IS605 OrfB family transposase
MTSFSRKRIILPIKQDNAFKRFKDIESEGYTFNSMLLLKRNGKYIIQAVMQKDIPNPKIRPNTIGIDIGSANLCSLSIITSDKRIIKQLYFGRVVAVKQHKISNRRSKLQSKADKGISKAIKALRKLRGYQSNFVNTRSWQVASKVVDLAVQYNTNINIENLKNLRTGRKLGNSKGRKVNGIINIIPYAKFFHALDCIALRNGIKVNRVSPRHTSQ